MARQVFRNEVVGQFATVFVGRHPAILLMYFQESLELEILVLDLTREENSQNIGNWLLLLWLPPNRRITALKSRKVAWQNALRHACSLTWPLDRV